MTDTDKAARDAAEKETINNAFNLFGSSAGAYSFIWEKALAYADEQHTEDVKALVDLLQRLRDWDMMGGEDASYWRAEIDRVLRGKYE